MSSVPVSVLILLFFFSSRRRHTRWTGDWSSDVCSSDLNLIDAFQAEGVPVRVLVDAQLRFEEYLLLRIVPDRIGVSLPPLVVRFRVVDQIGRASCRERVWSSGGGGSVEKKKNRCERKGV